MNEQETAMPDLTGIPIAELRRRADLPDALARVLDMFDRNAEPVSRFQSVVPADVPGEER